MSYDIGVIPSKHGFGHFYHRYSKGWDQVPSKYRSKRNYETFCYMRYAGMDALARFGEEIRRLES
jgi:hypothetical protein